MDNETTRRYIAMLHDKSKHVWSYNTYVKDFTEEWDEDGPQPEYGTYATLREAQIGKLREELEVSGGVLTPLGTSILIDLLEELSKGA